MTTPTAASHVDAAVTGVKPPLQGLLSMGSYKFVASSGEPDNSLDTVKKKDGLLQGVVVVATWRSLEKSATSGLTDDNEIDQGLAEVRKYNAAHPNAPLAVKLRVWSGPFAPDWVMDQSGGAVHAVHTNVNGVSKPWVIGRVWNDSYRKAWAHLPGPPRCEVRWRAARPRGRRHVVPDVHGGAFLHRYERGRAQAAP